MKVEVEEIEGCKRKLAVQAGADVVQKEWERAYGRVQKQARLPGFRKGHVPRSLVKVHFADDVRREVAEHLIPDIWRQAVSEARIDPVNEPDLSEVTLEEGAPLSFIAVVEVKPTIDVRDYTDLPVQHAAGSVTDADVEQTLGRMREQQAQLRSVERAAERGDVVVVDYTVTPQGHEPAGEQGYAFIVGEGAVMPEIDQAAVGMRAGEQRSLDVRFPDDHRREDLRGRAGGATIKVNEVKERVLPPLDDELAKSLGEFPDLGAVRAEIRKGLEAQREATDRQALEDKVVDALVGRHEFAVPEAMVMRQIAHQVEHARERMRRQGIDPDRVPWDFAKIVTDLKPGAERAVRRALILEAIAGREGLTPPEADIDAEVEKIAGASGRPVPAVRRMMEKSGDLEGLRHGLRERKTVDFLVQHARITPP
ncbi:MAG: trigger factor [Candidatus Rokubacteria bacterium]|nr:trigger factor [Candidatus Rokubacteria bacterium]